MLHIHAVAAGMILTSLPRFAHAQPAAPDLSPQASAKFEFDLAAGVLAPRLGGTVRIGPQATSDELTLENDLDLDSTSIAPNIEMMIRKNQQWELSFSGFDFSTDNSGIFSGASSAAIDGLTLDPGDPFEASLEWTSVAVEFAFWPNKWNPYQRGVNGSLVDLRFAFGGGIRHIDIDQRVSILTPPGGTIETGGEWMVPFATLQLEMRYDMPQRVLFFFDAVQIDGKFAFGPALGGDGGGMAQVQAGLTFLFNENLAFTFAYRLIEVAVENDEYEIQGGLQGLFFAGTLRF